MKPAPFDYLRAKSLDEALAALSDGTGGAKVIAGGQSLGPMLNLRLARPTLLVDIAGLPELAAFEDRGAHWFIGGAATHAQIEDAGASLGADRMLAAVAGRIAYRAVRNRGTIGGSLAHADPGADWPLALAALDAAVHIQGPQGPRQVAAADLMIGTFTTVLAEDEIITGVTVPKLGRDARWGYFKFCRKQGEFPTAAAALVADPKRDVYRAFLGALPTPPRPLPRLGDELRRGTTRIAHDVLADAVSQSAPDLDVVGQRMQTACLLRALEQAFPP